MPSGVVVDGWVFFEWFGMVFVFGKDEKRLAWLGLAQRSVVNSVSFI